MVLAFFKIFIKYINCFLDHAFENTSAELSKRSVLFKLIIAWSIGLKGFYPGSQLPLFFWQFEKTPTTTLPNHKTCCESPFFIVAVSARVASHCCSLLPPCFLKKRGGPGGALSERILWCSFHAWPTLQAASLLFQCHVCPRGRGMQPAAAEAGTPAQERGCRGFLGACSLFFPLSKKGWWWVLCCGWSWVYVALARPSQNVTGLSLFPCNLFKNGLN